LLQPFLSYNTASHTTFVLDTESKYDWETKEWSVPINFNVNQLLRVGKQLIQVGGGIRYWADSPNNGPEDWGIRFQIVLLYPR